MKPGSGPMGDPFADAPETTPLGKALNAAARGFLDVMRKEARNIRAALPDQPPGQGDVVMALMTPICGALFQYGQESIPLPPEHRRALIANALVLSVDEFLERIEAIEQRIAASKGEDR